MTYDLIVIGGGPGGYEAAAIGAARGEKVLLVEKDRLGGTCLNRGCIPTKCFCRSAQVAMDVADAARFGINLPGEAVIDLNAITARKNEVVGRLSEGVAMLVSAAEVVEGTARFTAPSTIEINGETSATAPKIIIATGSESAQLPIEGAHLAVTSTEMLDLTAMPRSLAVIGGGVIGLEFASVFAAFGVEVTVIEYCKEILPPFDKDIAKRLRTTLQKRGVKFMTSSEVKAIEQSESGMKQVKFAAKGKEQSVEAEIVLMAVGRRPVVPDGAEAAGIEIGRRGIVVDEAFETTAKGVYAIGDCNGVCLLAHAAAAQARTVMGETVDMSVIPSAVFTVPECAMVGLTEEQCKERQLQFKTGKSFFRANGKALAMGEEEGMVKLLADGNGIILGCHICGPHAADLIAEIALAISARIPVTVLTATIHAHPTLSEALTSAAAQLK